MPKKPVAVSKDPNKNWKNNAIQFPRLIAELEAMGVFTPAVLKSLSNEMDLTTGEVSEIIDRAQGDWDCIKAQTY